MTIKEYVNQLPGMAGKYAFEMGCPTEYGFDHQNCTGHCDDCLYAEDTINGEPAPRLFACPVRPGQIIYFILEKKFVIEAEVDCVTFFRKDLWRIEIFGCTTFRNSDWLVNIFPTREEAEKKLEEFYEKN